jgi:hypothetical protein
MKRIHSFDSFINEATANLAVVPVGLKGDQFIVKINGKDYGYAPKDDQLSLNDIAEKFKKILKFSSGRALAWLKKNTQLATGSAKNESEDLEFIGFDESIYEDDNFEVEEIDEASKKEEKEEKKEEKEEEKKEEKKEKKEEKKEDEDEDDVEEVDDFTPTSAKEFVEKFNDKHRDKLSKKEKLQLEKLEEILDVFIKERRATGRSY